MTSLPINTTERELELPDRESAMEMSENAILETYRALDEQRTELNGKRDELRHLLEDIDSETKAVIEERLNGMPDVGSGLESIYRPILELREELLRRRVETCEKAATELENYNHAIGSAITTIEELTQRAQDEKTRLEMRARFDAKEAQNDVVPPPAPADSLDESASTIRAALQDAIEVTEEDDVDIAPPVALSVTVGDLTEDNFYAGLDDGDSFGVFASTIELLPLGTYTDVEIKTEEGATLNVSGRVRWYRDWIDASPGIFPGMGIELLDVDAGQRRIIEDFMTKREPWLFV